MNKFDWAIASISSGEGQPSLSHFSLRGDKNHPTRTWTLTGNGTAYALAISPGGRQLAAAGSKGPNRVQIWYLDDDATPQQPPFFDQFPSSLTGVGALAFLDENRLVCGGRDGSLYLWDIRTLQPPRTWKGHAGQIFSVLALDGERFVSWSSDGHLIGWQATTCARLFDFTVISPSFPPALAIPVWDSEIGRLMLPAADGSLTVLDEREGFVPRNVPLHSCAVSAVAIVGARIISVSSEEGCLKAWDRFSLQEENRASTTVPLLQLQPLGHDRFVASGSDSMWVGDAHTLVLRKVADNLPLRSLRTLPRPLQDQRIAETLRQWRESLMSAAMAELATGDASGGFPAALSAAESFAERGFLHQAWRLRYARARQLNSRALLREVLSGLVTFTEEYASDLDVMLMLAEGFREVGDSDAARRWFSAIVEIDPRFGRAQEQLDALTISGKENQGILRARCDLKVSALREELDYLSRRGDSFGEIVIFKTYEERSTVGVPTFEIEKLVAEAQQLCDPNKIGEISLHEVVLKRGNDQRSAKVLRILPGLKSIADCGAVECWIEFKNNSDRFQATTVSAVMNPAWLQGGDGSGCDSGALLEWLQRISVKDAPALIWLEQVKEFFFGDVPEYEHKPPNGIFTALGNIRSAQLSSKGKGR